MKVILNNNEEIIDTDRDQLTITEIREIKKFTFSHLVVKINNVLVKKSAYDKATVKEGDKVDIIHLISGG